MSEPRETTPVHIKSMPTEVWAALGDLAEREGTSRPALLVAGAEALLRQRGVGTGAESLDATHAAYRVHRERLRAALGEMALTEPEASLICDAMNGCYLPVDAGVGPLSAGGCSTWLYAEVADAIALNSLDEKWEVDGGELLRRLRSLTPLQGAAVMEA